MHDFLERFLEVVDLFVGCGADNADEGGDNGTPVALDEDSVTGRAFLSLAASVVRQVDRRNVEMAPTQIVEMHK